MLTTTLKPKKCRCCKAEFMPARPMQRACGVMCGLELGRKKRLAQEAKAKREEKKVDRAQRQKLKPRSKWLSECQAIVNRYQRLKALARGEGCFTCGATPAQKFGGTYDAGHFRSVGSAPHLRFWLPQIRLQCIVCNRHKGGMALAFRRALVAEHGAEWVEALEAMQHSAKFDIPYLMRLKRVMGKRLRRLEKRIQGEAG